MKQENLYLLKFAWKNISRYKGRSFFIGLSVALSVCIAVWVMAFFDGLNYQIEQAVVKTNTGYFQLQEKNYSQTTDSENPLELKSDLEHQLKNSTSILSYSPELLLDGNISTPEGSAPLVMTGIIPELHENFLPVSKNISQGHFLTSNSDGVLIGEELAQEFKFSIGDQLVINYQDISGELRSELLEIKGIYHFNSKLFEKRFVYITQMQWQKLFLKEMTKSGQKPKLLLLHTFLHSIFFHQIP